MFYKMYGPQNGNHYVEDSSLNLSSASKELESRFESLNDIETRIDAMEITNRAYWSLFMERGFTHEDLNKAIPQALKISKDKEDKRDQELKKYKDINEENEKDRDEENSKQTKECEKCGRRMQVASVFVTRCIYCGHKIFGNPYEVDTIDEKHGETGDYSIQ